MSRSRSLVALGVAALTLTLTGAARAATQRQEASSFRDEVTTAVAVSWGSTTVAGSLLVGVVSLKGTAATTITPPTGRGWTLANRVDDGVVSVAIYYSANAAAQSTASQSWAVGGALPAVVQLIEYQGVNTTSPLDRTGSATGFGTSATVTASAVTSQAAELAITGIAVHRRPTLTVAGTDFAQVGTTTQTGGTSGATGTRVSGASWENLYTGTSTPTTTVAFSGTTTRDWAAAMVTFKLPSKYWIGCTGNVWTTAACWSTSSGGTANTTAPGTSEVVIFDGAGATGQNSPVLPAGTTTIGAIDMKSTYTGTFSVPAGRTLSVGTDLSVAGGTFTGGGTVTFSTAGLHLSGGVVNGNGSAFAPNELGVSGGTYNTGTATHAIGGPITLSGGTIATGTGNFTASGALTMTGGALTTGGTVTVTGDSTISGGTLTQATASKTTTFSGDLTLSGTGAVATTAGTFTVSGLMSLAGGTYTGAASTTTNFSDLGMTGGTVTTASSTVTISNNVALSGGTYNNTGTTTTLLTNTSTLTLSGTAAVNVTGGTFHVTRAVTMSGTSAYTSATGATSTFDTTLDVNGGTFTLGGGTIDVTQAVTIDGGAYSGAGTNNFDSTLDVDSGTFDANGGSVIVAGAVRVRGGTYTGKAAFASTLAVSAGTFDANGAAVTVTGAVTVSGTGTYTGSGTNTFSSTLGVSAGNFDATGTVNVAGQVTISGGTYRATGGTSTFSRSASPALSVTAGTIDTNGGTIRVPNNATTISGGTFQTTTGTATFGGTVTVSGTGTYDALGGTSTAAGLVTVSGGTYEIGSSATGQVMSAGMTISGGTLDGSVSTGVLKIAAGSAFLMSSGTLQTSTGVTTGPIFNVSGSGTYTFTVSGGTVSLNGGKFLGVSNTAGVSIGALATISQLDYVDFANVPATNPAGTSYLLSIAQNTLSLRSTGCKFDYNPATFTNLKTVRLTDAGTGVDVRAWFQAKNAATNGAAAGDAYDADEDTSPDDGVGDAGNKAVVYWSYGVATDTAGAIQGVPTAAFDWNTGAYYSTYAVFTNIGGASTADRIYVRDTDGLPVSSYDIANTDGDIVGTPLWTTESSVHVLYIATSLGKIYRLVDTAGTLAISPSGNWTTAFTSATVTGITSPLIDDGTNLYFGGKNNANNRVYGVSKSAKTLVKNVAAAAAISAAPSWKISGGITYLFAGSATTGAQAYIYRINMVPTGAVDATCLQATTSIGSATRLVSNVLYAGDGSAKLHGIDALNTAVGGFANKTGFPYQDTASHAPVTLGAIQGTPWVDASIGRIFFGDNDGHLYAITTAGVKVTNYPIKLSTTNQIRVSPIYVPNSGVVVVGDSGGNVYYVDVKNASSAPAVFYTTTLGGAVSSISYNNNVGQFMVGTSTGILEMLPVKTDPTPTFVY